MFQKQVQTALLILVCVFAMNADAKRAKKVEAADEVAESIARARSTDEFFDVNAPSAATTPESADLKAMLDDSKLVANASEANMNVVGSTSTTSEAAVPVATDEAAAVDTTAKAATEEISKKNEKDIPVLSSKTKTAKSSGSAVTRILASLAVLTIVLFATTLGLKRWSKRRQGKTQHTAIKILTQHYIGPKKSLAIVQVAGESILIGVTDQNITMLKSLSLLDEEVPEVTPRNFDTAMGDMSDMNDMNDLDLRGLNDIRDKVSRSLRGMKDF